MLCRGVLANLLIVTPEACVSHRFDLEWCECASKVYYGKRQYLKGSEIVSLETIIFTHVLKLSLALRFTLLQCYSTSYHISFDFDKPRNGRMSTEEINLSLY